MQIGNVIERAIVPDGTPNYDQAITVESCCVSSASVNSTVGYRDAMEDLTTRVRELFIELLECCHSMSRRRGEAARLHEKYFETLKSLAIGGAHCEL